MAFTDQLSIKTGGSILSGWTQESVSRSIEQIPSQFQVSLTEKFPNSSTEAIVIPGNTCEIYLGQDLVMTGFIDVYSPRYNGQTHFVTISGRSKCEDLVDCSIINPPWSVNSNDLKGAITQLIKPFNITLVMQNDVPIAQPDYAIQIQLGQSPIQIIEELTRISNVLYWDDAQGNLNVGLVGQQRMNDSLVEGQNILSGAGRIDYSKRFAVLKTVGSQFSLSTDQAQLSNEGQATDSQIRSTRTKLIVMDTSTGPNNSWAQQEAQWQVNRRFGRSQRIEIQVVGWRDSSGLLWTPGNSVGVQSPNLKINMDMVISECTWERNENGTITSMVLMPPSAFTPEPFHPTSTYSTGPT